MPRVVRIIICVFTLLYGVRFFNIYFLRWLAPTNTILLIISLGFFLLLVNQKRELLYEGFIKNVIIFCFLSMLSCNFFRGQTIVESIPMYTDFFSLGLFSVFVFVNLDVNDMHKILIGLSLLATILYIIQFYVYPFPLCLNIENINTDLKDITNSRIRMTGQSFIFVGFVLGFIRYMQSKKYYYLFLACICFYAIFLMGFRSMTMISIVFMIVSIIRTFKLNLSSIIAIGGIFLVGYEFTQTDIFQSILENMLLRNERDNFENTDYARVVQAKFWINDFFVNPIEPFFGSGLPNETSEYGKYMDVLASKEITYYDFGIISYIVVIGFVPVLYIIKNYLSSIFVPVNEKFRYLSIWLVYLLSISVLSCEFVRQGCMTIQAFVLAMISISYSTQKSS